MRVAAQRRLDGEPSSTCSALALSLTGPRARSSRPHPRPETEELVGSPSTNSCSAVSKNRSSSTSDAARAPLGSRCSSNFAKLGVHATLVAVDSSRDALDVTRANAAKHGLEGVTTVHSSWFEALDESLLGRVDLIVANPPYVGAAEFATLDPVLGYEPLGALVSEDTVRAEGFLISK